MATTKSLFGYLTDIFNDKDNENGLIIIDTIMKACGFDDDEKETVNKKGLKEVSDIINHKILAGDLTSKKFLDQLFALPQDDLDQLPIEYFALIVKSDTFNKDFSKDEKNKILGRIFHTIGLDSVHNLDIAEPEKVAYNCDYYRDIYQAFYALNKTSDAQEQALISVVDTILDKKMQEMLDKAPDLAANSHHALEDAMNLSAKHKGDLDKAADEVLNSFDDTKDFAKSVTGFLATNGLNKKYEQYSFKTAKAVLAQYKLGAWARAAAKLELRVVSREDGEKSSTDISIDEKDVEKFSVVDPAKNKKSINRLINAARNVVANFTKPQKLVRLGFRTTATQLVTKGIAHFTEAAIPWVGAAVGLVMTISETAIKAKQEKKKPVAARKTTADIWKEAAPDLARGVITVGGSAIGLGFISGPIATLASNFVKSLQVAHNEGLTAGHGFWKRVGKEMLSKKNLVNLGFSIAGAATGKAIKEAGGLSGIWNKITSRDKTSVTEETDITSVEESTVEENSGNKFFEKFGIKEKLDQMQHQQYKSELKTSNVTDQTYYIDKNGNGHVISNAKYNSDYKMGEYKADLKMGDVKEGLNGEHFVDHNGNLQFGSRKFIDVKDAHFYDQNVQSLNNRIGAAFAKPDPKLDPKTLIPDENGDLEQIGARTPSAGSTEELVDPIFQKYPGAQADKNGWLFYEKVVNGKKVVTYVTDEETGKMQHLSNPELVKYRALKDNEMLNEAGNIVNRPASATSTPSNSNSQTTTATQTTSTLQRTQAISIEQQKTLQSTQTQTYVKPPVQVAGNPVGAPQTTNAQNTSSTSVPSFVNGQSMNSKTPYEQALDDFAEQENLFATHAKALAEAQRHMDAIDERIKDGTATAADIASRNEWENLKNTVENWKSAETNKLEELGAQVESTRPEEVVAQGETYKQEIDATFLERIRLEKELDALRNDSSADQAQIKALEAQIAGKENEIQDRFDYLEENKLIKEGEAFTEEQLKKLIPEEPQAVVEQQEVETSVEGDKNINGENNQKIIDGLPVRSEEELMKIQQAAKRAEMFNSLPTEQQQELIKLQAQMQIAEAKGDTTAHETYKTEFDTKFRQYAADDIYWDHVSEQANIKGTPEWHTREIKLEQLKNLSGRQHSEALQELESHYGMVKGTKDGVVQMVRSDGNVQMDVPSTTENFVEAGFRRGVLGSWVKEEDGVKTLVRDSNRNGVFDEGDWHRISKDSKILTYGKLEGESVDPEVAKNNYKAEDILKDEIKKLDPKTYEQLYGNQTASTEKGLGNDNK